MAGKLYDRTLLVPEHLDHNPVWRDLMSAVDEAFSAIDQGILDMSMLRSPLKTDDAIYTANYDAGKLTKLTDVRTLERPLTVQLCNQLGFAFKSSDILNPSDFVRIATNIGQYYATTKGTPGWQNFFAFCLNSVFEVKALWTTDYVTFVEEGSAGTPIWNGGAWYPTTHVSLFYQTDEFIGVTESIIRAFFYYFANINLILESITIDITFPLDTVWGVDAYLEIWVGN